MLLSHSIMAQSVAIRAGHVVDPATGQTHDNQIITIKDHKIVAVDRDLDVSRADQVIDLPNAWVLPGLMDAHVHLTLNVPENLGRGVPFETFYLTESNAFRALRGAKNAGATLQAGFTTVKDIGNDGNYAVTDVKKAISAGWFEGPTIINAGKIIAAFGGQSKGISPEQGLFWQYEYLDADSPDEIRKAVRQNIYYGATAIKLVADNSAYYYSEDEIRAAVEEGHKAGLAVTVHVQGGEAARNVILGGADAIEHGFELDDELLQLMKDKGTYLVGTDFPLSHLQAMGFFIDDPETLANAIIHRLRRANEIGVKMAFGTDIVVDLDGRTRGDLALDFLDVWEAAGVPAAKILQCMTTNAADLLRLENRGTIATGQYADIIAVPENPLRNIHTLKNVQFVMKEGRIVKQAHGASEMTRK